jgi:chromatin segregation and condensation protein Rec8/ScpA/Scc1 (kleisin family)
VADASLFARPPLNVLIDPSLARRRSPWEINLSELLDLFLQAISQKEIIDMRAAGTAILSSATIYRLKVETLFLFERLRAQRRLVDASEPPQIIVMPFRYEVYSTNIEELFDELGRILQEIVTDEGEGGRESVLSVAELPAPNLEDYVISIQTILSEFRKILVERLRATGKALLSELVRGLEPIDAARVFILLLFAANSGEVVINQEEADEDALVVSVGQLE